MKLIVLGISMITQVVQIYYYLSKYRVGDCFYGNLSSKTFTAGKVDEM